MEPQGVGSGMSWRSTSLVMLGDMFGLGQLTLPQTFARVGWLPGLSLLIGFCVLTLYSARLYTRLAVSCPEASMFDQVAHRALGRLGTGLVWLSCYVSILICPLIFQITCAEALKQVLYQYPISSLQANLVVALLMIPLAQFQHLEGVAMVSTLGTLGQTVAVTIVIAKLTRHVWLQHTGALPPSEIHVAGTSSFAVAIVGVMDTQFMYGGQPNWWRYICSMSDRREFTRAGFVAVGFMTTFYLCVATVGYLALGDNIDLTQALTSLLVADSLTAIMNAGLFLHCLFAYQININVWASSFIELVRSCSGGGSDVLEDDITHTSIDTIDLTASASDDVKAPLLLRSVDKQCPEMQCTAAADSHQDASGLNCRVTWALLTCTCIALCVVFSLTLPFFSLVMAVIGACGDAMALVGLPCLMTVFLIPALPQWERVVCWTAVFGAVGLSALGMYSSTKQLLEAYEHTTGH